jgi:hypothetical protein
MFRFLLKGQVLYLLRALANTGASSSIILEAYTSATFPFIKTDAITWSIIGDKFTTTKTGICLWHFHSQSLISRHKYVALDISCRWPFWVIKHIWYDYWPRKRYSWRIRYYHEGTLSSVEALIDMAFISAQMSHKRLDMNILGLPKFLMLSMSQQA